MAVKIARSKSADGSITDLHAYGKSQADSWYQRLPRQNTTVDMGRLVRRNHCGWERNAHQD